MKKTLVWTGLLTAAAFLISAAAARGFSLLGFINTLFYITAFIILLALLTTIVQKGFFDGIFFSFRKVFEIQQQDDGEEISRLSDLFKNRTGPLYGAGAALLAIMLAALGLYYL